MLEGGRGRGGSDHLVHYIFLVNLICTEVITYTRDAICVEVCQAAAVTSPHTTLFWKGVL